MAKPRRGETIELVIDDPANVVRHTLSRPAARYATVCRITTLLSVDTLRYRLAESTKRSATVNPSGSKALFPRRVSRRLSRRCLIRGSTWDL